MPAEVTKDEYVRVREHKEYYQNWYVGYVGCICSFRGRYFEGFAPTSVTHKNGGVRNYQYEQLKNFSKQKDDLLSVVFESIPYQIIEIPFNSVVYCDPPYAGTTKYRTSKNFDYEEFWEWCRNKTKEGHDVLISEHNAPSDFICIWEKELKNLIGNVNRNSTERLFVHQSIADKYKE